MVARRLMDDILANSKMREAAEALSKSVLFDAQKQLQSLLASSQVSISLELSSIAKTLSESQRTQEEAAKSLLSSFESLRVDQLLSPSIASIGKTPWNDILDQVNGAAASASLAAEIRRTLELSFPQFDTSVLKGIADTFGADALRGQHGASRSGASTEDVVTSNVVRLLSAAGKQVDVWQVLALVWTVLALLFQLSLDELQGQITDAEMRRIAGEVASQSSVLQLLRTREVMRATRLRTKPLKNSKTSLAVPAGSMVVCLEYWGKWVQVKVVSRDVTGETVVIGGGWIAKKYLAPAL